MINLLPFRERRRAASRRRLLASLVATALLALLLITALERGLNARITARAAAIESLRAQIALLAGHGAEAARLRREQSQAASHMRVLSALQRSRALPARVLAELSQALPAEAHYQRLERADGELRLEGFALSHAAVAELMRMLSASNSFAEARLVNVGGADSEGAAPQLLRFRLLLVLDETGD